MVEVDNDKSTGAGSAFQIASYEELLDEKVAMLELAGSCISGVTMSKWKLCNDS